MKILYDYQAFSMQKYGGISRYFIELNNRLNKQENCETIILAPFFINLFLNSNNGKNVIGNLIPVLPKTKKLREFANHFTSNLLITKLNVDIYHETYYSRLPLRRLKGIKYVATVYDMIHEKFASSFKDSYQVSKAKKRSVQDADLVFCISENTKQDLIDIFNVDKSKVIVTYLGWECACFGSKTNEKIVDSEYILYVGVRDGYKNFDRLLDAYANIDKIRNNFKLIAFGPDVFTKTELNKIDSLRLNDRVICLRGNNSLLMRLYESASVFVYPSLYEGFGIPPLEAMSNNCPVICSNTSSLPEVVGNAAELFDPYEIESISSSMIKVLFNSARRKELIKRGKEQVKLFSWNNCAVQTLKGYRSLY
jgi:Glycosyltransferase